MLTTDCLAYIFEQVSNIDLTTIMQATGTMRTLAQGEFRRRVDVQLRPWFTNPIQTLQVITDHGAVLSGSLVTHFMHNSPRKWFPTDADLYSPAHSWWTLLRHFVDVEGYTWVNEDRMKAEIGL